MADAIPVHRPVAPVEPSKKEPKAPAVPANEHDAYIGKDHPEFGTWVGSGWRKDH